ncbi:MAG: discoidin domain-containing protein [Clostridia bacterium]|nr:discoidin domain-containing protein [Clostridia bacterium]
MKKLLSVLSALTLILALFAVPSFAEEYLDRSDWTFKASSEISWGFIDEAFDGKADTFWHTFYKAEGSTVTEKDKPPHTVEINLPKAENISGIAYLPRQDHQSGRLLSFEVYISSSGNDKGEKAATVTISDQTSTDEVKTMFAKTYSAKKITIVVTKSAGDIGACAEFNFIGGTDGVKTEESKAESTTTATLDKSTWTAKASTEISWGLVEEAYDGKEDTYWHTMYTAEGSTITSKAELPHILEFTFPKAETVTAVKYLPRQDGQSGRWLEAEIYASLDGNGKGDLVTKATFKQEDAAWQTVNFGKSVTAKKITIVITKSAGGHGTCAEIDFLTSAVTSEKEDNADGYIKNGKFDTSKWQITATSEKAGWGAITKAFDGDASTFWHTHYDEADGKILGHDMPPYDVDIVLPELSVITGFAVTPRPGNAAGKIKAYKLYMSKEDEGEFTLLMEGTLLGAIATEKIEFNCGVEAKRIRFEVLEGQAGYATMAELEFFPGDSSTQIVAFEDLEKTMNENSLHKIDSSVFKAENELPTWANCSAGMVFDGTMSGLWQTDDLSGRTDPVILSTDLGKVHEFSAISITPRQSADYHGYWLEFNIWASEDGENFEPLVENYSFPKRTLDEKFIHFDEPVKARYVEFEITKYNAYRVSCGEISFWQNYNQKMASEDGGSFVMQIGSKDIKVEKGGETYTKTIDVAPYITSAGSTLIPLRGLLEEMGAEIEWIGDTQTIKVTKDSLKIELQIQNKLVYVDDPVYGLTMYTLTSAPRIKDSRTFIPVRFVSEQLGYTVGWDGATQTITITK